VQNVCAKVTARVKDIFYDIATKGLLDQNSFDEFAKSFALGKN
jgi:hypothetical protein